MNSETANEPVAKKMSKQVHGIHNTFHVFQSGNVLVARHFRNHVNLMFVTKTVSSQAEEASSGEASDIEAMIADFVDAQPDEDDESS